MTWKWSCKRSGRAGVADLRGLVCPAFRGPTDAGMNQLPAQPQRSGSQSPSWSPRSPPEVWKSSRYQLGNLCGFGFYVAWPAVWGVRE